MERAKGNRQIGQEYRKGIGKGRGEIETSEWRYICIAIGNGAMPRSLSLSLRFSIRFGPHSICLPFCICISIFSFPFPFLPHPLLLHTQLSPCFPLSLQISTFSSCIWRISLFSLAAPPTPNVVNLPYFTYRRKICLPYNS